MSERIFYDPPSGWRYGFPKEYLPLENETIEETLVRDGYPTSEFDIHGKVIYCRFWRKEDEV